MKVWNPQLQAHEWIETGEAPKKSMLQDIADSINNPTRRREVGNLPKEGVIVREFKEGTLWACKPKKKGPLIVFKFVVPSHPHKANYWIRIYKESRELYNDKEIPKFKRSFGDDLLNRVLSTIDDFLAGLTGKRKGQ